MDEGDGGSCPMDGMQTPAGGSDIDCSAGGCQISPLKKAIPFTLLASGKLQEIRIDLKKILNKIIMDLGARSQPLFTETDCAEEGVKVSIKLDLCFVEENLVAIVEGSPSMNKFTAEKSAVMMAFKHIDENCNIRNLDFSSKVASSFTQYRTYATVHECLDAIVNIMDNFKSTLRNYNDYALELTVKSVNSKHSASVSGVSFIYSTLLEALLPLMKASSEKLDCFRQTIEDIGIETMKLHRRATDKSKTLLNKCYVKNVVLPTKELFRFVLTSFSLAPPKYSNCPDGQGVVIGTAKFKIPSIDSLKYCGNIKIEGKGSSSRDAEEDAAYKSLVFFEKSYNVKIIDLNHSDRVDAEDVQKMLVSFVDRIVEVSAHLKEIWDKMDESLEEQRQKLYNGTSRIGSAQMIEHELVANKSCADGLEAVLQNSIECQEACSSVFERLGEISCEILLVKNKLNIG